MVCANKDDWTAKRAIIASNARVLSLFSPLKSALFQADLPLSFSSEQNYDGLIEVYKTKDVRVCKSALPVGY